MSKAQSWFEIKAVDAAKGAADVYLYGGIGHFEISALAFVAAIKSLDVRSINLYVNSPGGVVDDGIAIYNALKRHPAKVHAVVDGLAASIASVIVQAADSIKMMLGSVMIIHDAHMGIDAFVMGDAADMRNLAAEATNQAEKCDLLSDNIAAIYAEHAGGKPSEWRDRMKTETWYQPQEAVVAGLAHSVEASKRPQNSVFAFNLAGFPFKNVPDWVKTAPEVPGITLPEPKIAAPDPIAVVRSMSIPAAMKKTAIAHLKAHPGVTAAA